MELLTIRESSLGAFAESFQAAILQGYRHSQEPSRYAWSDNQYNAVLELKPFVEHPADANGVGQDESEPSTDETPAKQTAGRPRRKL